MSKEQQNEVFMPPNLLKAKVGGTIAGLDTAAIKRAAEAVENLKTEFSDWLADDIARLGGAYDAFRAARDGVSCGDLFRASHDLKGQATTFEFPMVARVASSLCKLMDTLGSHDKVPLPLVEAHVDAIRVIHRDKIKDISNLTALTLAEELETRVTKALAHVTHRS
ncbi:MAG: Hpt domain-containing protein [Alphaproteobacteria bacterium]|nr:Hpt domain-containing protein [Alphaproteobacteria bacterium]MDE2495044.1 Hpt domain-containing protein [Alphaproteobacteria bacterium]